MRGHAAAQTTQSAEVARGFLGWNAVQPRSKQRLERNAEMRHQQQRGQVGRTELAICAPVLAVPWHKRRHIDERRLGTPPLNVERRCIFEYPTVRDARLKQAQLQQRGVLEHGKRPLVGPSEEAHRFVRERALPARLDNRARVRRVRMVGAENVRANDIAAAHHILEKRLR